jgi:hypothetical protein
MNDQEWSAAANRLLKQLLNARRDLGIGRPDIAARRGKTKFTDDFREKLQELTVHANSEDQSARRTK